MASTVVPSGSTRVGGLIGWPARYSLSPAIHAAAYESLGLDATYVVFPVLPEHLVDAVKAIRAFQLMGVSITLPHKEEIVGHLDGLSPTAERLGAVNTVVPGADGLVGHNTDGAGFIAALTARGFDVVGKKCAVLGAGGAAKAVIVALEASGASEVVVINRSPGRGAEAAALGGEGVRVGSARDIAGCDLLVNATPVGMDARPGVPIAVDAIGPNHFVADLIYAPRRTELLRLAEDGGAATMNGLSMLVHQAAEQIHLWTGGRPDTAIMQAAVVEQ